MSSRLTVVAEISRRGAMKYVVEGMVDSDTVALSMRRNVERTDIMTSKLQMESLVRVGTSIDGEGGDFIPSPAT